MPAHHLGALSLLWADVLVPPLAAFFGSLASFGEPLQVVPEADGNVDPSQGLRVAGQCRRKLRRRSSAFPNFIWQGFLAPKSRHLRFQGLLAADIDLVRHHILLYQAPVMHSGEM